MPRFRLTLEYDGRDFCGWQLQPHQRTVQLEIETAIERLMGHFARVYPSGRTDAGVNATGAVCMFDTDVERTPLELLRGLNSKLPDDVAVVDVAVAPHGFDARSWSWGKRYRYRWLVREAGSPLRRSRVWHHRHPLDVEAMSVAAAHLVGRHDFSSFCAARSGVAHAVRSIWTAGITPKGDEVHFDIHGQGFLRHMVRIIAGTLTDIGRQRRPPEWMAEVIEARDRSAAARTAPAHGLELVEVVYGDGPPPWTEHRDR